MEKRLIIALALSLAILFIYQKLFVPKKQITAPLKVTGEAVPEGKYVTTAAVQETEIIPQEAETLINTDLYNISFSDVGGTIKEWRVDGEELTVADDFSNRIGALKSDLFGGVDIDKYKAQKGRDFVEFAYTAKNGIKVTKRYNLHKSLYNMDLEITITNVSPTAQSFSYQMVGPSGIQEVSTVMGRSFREADVQTGEGLIRKGSAKGIWTVGGNIQWVALKNRYYAAILKPFSDMASASVEGDKKAGFTTFVRSRNFTLSPGEEHKDVYLIYGGPLDAKTLKAYGYGFENAIYYGWFGAISKALLVVLRFLHGVVKNWGVAIILLTMLVNFCSFPLTRKSFMSMHQMKKVQPHMQKLRELHKDNPQRLNKEMMELYKKYNVNPFGGCLPMLLQIPIFIALYQGLIRAIELKGAHFLWIKDLAQQEAIKIPFTLPFIGASLNILPLVMVGMMFVQQKITQSSTAAVTEEQAQQQKMMTLMMPIVFGFIFYKMPSGLVLYWLTNTILMTTEQTVLAKKYG